MKCPNYIRDALKQRARYARRFMELDWMIAEWLEKHDLLYLVEEYDIHGGCESYVNPDASSARILEVIKNA